MRLLLDTQIFIWCTADERRLPKRARALILTADEVLVSSASVWEAAIKSGLGKLHVDMDALVESINGSGFVELPVTARHAAGVGRLPSIHRDPFDRLLIAQAITEPLRFLTADPLLRQYTELAELV